MTQLDCIVLGWGNLVLWKWKRSEWLKWNEKINGKKLWLYILETLESREIK